MMLLAFILLLVNFGISWYNAWAVGQVWADSKAAGGWARVVAWSGAIMSACGFTYVYLIILAFIAGATGHLPPRYVNGALELGYVVIIFPILGSGMALWVQSLMVAWRERTFGNIGVAAWNTYAQIHNTYEAATMLPNVFKDLGNLFDGDDDDAQGKLLMLVILLVLVSLIGGVLTTVAILRSSAKSVARTVRSQARYA